MAEMNEQVRELDRIAKRLVRRDFELMQTNEAMRLLDEEKQSTKHCFRVLVMELSQQTQKRK